MSTITARPYARDDAAVIAEQAADPYRIRDINPPPRSIVSIGANIGAFSLFAAEVCRDATIYAYEPDPDNFAALVHNIAEGGLTARIVAVNAAVAGHRGNVTLSGSETLSHICVAEDPNTCIASSTHERLRSVPAVTLADACAPFAHVDLLKVDVEGSEFEVFAEPCDVLVKVDHLRMEIHDYRTPEALAALWATLGCHFTMTEVVFTPGRGGLWFGDRR